MALIKIPGYRCERCGHEWAPREKREADDLPTICPKCKSPYWNRPRNGSGRRAQSVK
jgi:predicted Zn-ribbon and HTH transcriptional regulator